MNLAPADLKKEGPSFDLPIALAMVAASRTKPFNADDCCVVGELGLDGAVRPVKGVLSIALEAKRRGRTRVLVPEANAPEAAVIEGIQVFPIRNLKEAWDFLEGDLIIPPFHLDRRAFFNSHRCYEVDFDEVRGQHHVKRALEVAAAGGHQPADGRPARHREIHAGQAHPDDHAGHDRGRGHRDHQDPFDHRPAGPEAGVSNHPAVPLRRITRSPTPVC